MHLLISLSFRYLGDVICRCLFQLVVVCGSACMMVCVMARTAIIPSSIIIDTISNRFQNIDFKEKITIQCQMESKMDLWHIDFKVKREDHLKCHSHV